ncbi:hypothetical protein HJD18_08545 [Thermoleophilia bacterium SCSIO 60948]|nr:hypothetical protein HJD18_08545 [Thermoleophilia bacterium SCSIO 60948]
MPGLDLILIALAYAPRLERRPTAADLRAGARGVGSEARRRVVRRTRSLALVPLAFSNRMAGVRRRFAS